MLSQLVQNEQVHVQNISDEQREMRLLEDQVGQEQRKQAQFAQ